MDTIVKHHSPNENVNNSLEGNIMKKLFFLRKSAEEDRKARHVALQISSVRVPYWAREDPKEKESARHV